MSKTQDGKMIINIIVNNDVPSEDFANIWAVAHDNNEPCIETQVSNIAEVCKLLEKANSELFLLVHGGQKTFEEICIKSNVRNVQWMPHSGC